MVAEDRDADRGALVGLGHFFWGLGLGVLLDVPWVFDDAFRRADFWLNRRLRGNTENDVRIRWVTPANAFFAATIVISIYGPTFDALCSAVPRGFAPTALWLLSRLLAIATVGYAAWALYKAIKTFEYRSKQLLKSAKGSRLRGRQVATLLAAIVIGWVPVAAPVTVAVAMAYGARSQTLCRGANFAWVAVGQFVLAVGLVTFAVKIPTMARGIAGWLRKPTRNQLRCEVCLSSFLRTLLLPAAYCGLRVLTWSAKSSGKRTLEANYLPYVTTFSAEATFLIVVALLVSLWAGAVPPKTWKSVRRALSRCELFVKRSDPTVRFGRYSYALLGCVTHPLVTLLFPALAVAIASRESLYRTAVGWLIGGVLFAAMGSITSRWDQLVALVQRWFLTGPALVVSVFLMALGAARLKDVSYVSYVLDAAPFGAVTMTLVFCYALAWHIETILNEPLQAALLDLLAPRRAGGKSSVDLHLGRVPYPLLDQGGESQCSETGRSLQIHGMGRFAVVGTHRRDNVPLFHSYDKIELFERLVENERRFLVPAKHAGLVDQLHGLQKRARSYFALANVALALVALGLFLWIRSADTSYRRNPIIRVPTMAVEGNFDLRRALRKAAATGRPAVLVSASGGGTRAALFAMSALRGLTVAGHGEDVLLMSGVSGGAVATAYFATHREALLDRDKAVYVPAWHDFDEAMSFNHIEDVLEGAAELRTFGRVSLGVLLAESLERSFRSWRTKPDQLPATFGELRDGVGLILNTTIAAHPHADSSLLRQLFRTKDPRYDVFASLSGGRLIFTNLNSRDGFPRWQVPKNAWAMPPEDVDLTYKVVRDPGVKIASAAAASANFPAVFSNIGIDILEDTVGGNACAVAPKRARYYVTDGGVNENRGLISLLYALDGALAGMDKHEPVPRVEVLALDASEMSFDYSQDRGLAVTFTGRGNDRLASGLERLLVERVQARAARVGCPPEVIRVRYLTMPAVFTSRGGFGTHWMLPETVILRDPRDPENAAETRSVSRDELKEMVTECLFPVGIPRKDPELCTTTRKYLPLPEAPQDAASVQCVDGWDDLQAELNELRACNAPCP
ncbi:MAG: patatin-like phospholipase family protein [Pseudomonadota bacterium]